MRQDAAMIPDSLTPWQGPLAAFLLALGWAGLLRRRRPGIAALALGLGTVLGFAIILGVGLASPRQIFERLPALALAGLVLAVPLALTTARAVVGAMFVLAAILTGWWMSGAPLQPEDAVRAAPSLLAISLAAALLLGELGGAWRGIGAAGLLAALLAIAAPPGPWLLLGAVVAAACCGTLVAGPSLSPAARLPLAMVVAGVMGGPVLARGAATDWGVALGPLALLLLAPRLAGGLRGRWVLPVWAGLGLGVLGLVWLLRTWS